MSYIATGAFKRKAETVRKHSTNSCSEMEVKSEIIIHNTIKLYILSWYSVITSNFLEALVQMPIGHSNRFP
jgi:hypothetical protein